MTTYLFLLRPESLALGDMPPEAHAALFDRFVRWSESLKERGCLRAVESLMDAGGATLRKSGGAIVVDGPYAEVKELVSGLFVVEADGEQAARAIAAECPLLDVGGSVEVREIAPFPVRP
ncbi:MAG: transcription initiation protein [Myxococcales bacterium]|nr:transcription initiation protein [Myxococcales bacterium]